MATKIILIITIIFAILISTSCENGFKFEKVYYNASGNYLYIDNNSYVIDSINIKHKDKVIYVSKLINKNKGSNKYKLDSINNDYKVILNKIKNNDIYDINVLIRKKRDTSKFDLMDIYTDKKRVIFQLFMSGQFYSNNDKELFPEKRH